MGADCLTEAYQRHVSGYSGRTILAKLSEYRFTIDGLNVKLGVEEAEHGVSQLVIDADRGSARDSNTEIALAGSIAERPTQPSIPS